IVGEPTGMQAATSERGLLVIDGEARGESGHAARGDGVNALYLAMEDIARLRAHKFTRISPEMGEVRLHVTQILSGTAHNVIPDRCRFVVDIRPNELYTPKEILDELQTVCQSHLEARNLLHRASATAAESPLRKAAAALGIKTVSSPTSSDWMQLPCDAIKMGPGDSARSHKANEFILVSEIDQAIDKYIHYIETVRSTVLEQYGNTME
ncbi:MAG: peptidase dimerization domain-containing protein, partial [Bacteroidales bacterium]|nr:peptidase dimerization domain-containing protein [Bacteroidales bacterium]